MKKVLFMLLAVLLSLSCSTERSTTVQPRRQPVVVYRYYVPGYWTWRDGTRIYVHGYYHRVKKRR